MVDRQDCADFPSIRPTNAAPALLPTKSGVSSDYLAARDNHCRSYLHVLQRPARQIEAATEISGPATEARLPKRFLC